MDDDSLLGDLAAAATALHRPGQHAPAALDGDVRERLEDLLRRDSVAARYREAIDPQGGERPRLLWRALRPYWTASVTCEIDAELARFDSSEADSDQRTGDWSGAGDSFVALAECSDPRQRSLIARRVLEHLARRRPLVEAAIDARDEAAREIGASDRLGLLDAGTSIDRESVVAEFERVALQPFDDAVAAHVAGLGRASVAGRDDDHQAAEMPRRVALLDRHSAVTAAVIGRTLIEAAGVISAVPRIESSTTSIGRPRRWIEPGPFDSASRLFPGSLGGPVAMLHALDALGRTLRAGFLGPMEPLRGRWLDPTFDRAAGALFRRLALDPVFRGACGLPRDESLANDLRFEAALAPRLAWAYVHHGPGGPHEARRSAFDERVGRAVARACWAGEWTEIVGRDACGIEHLRGEMLAVLYEERLRTRHGRGWYRERRARNELRELWDAERHATPDDVATAFGLGTIDGATILEGCRP